MNRQPLKSSVTISYLTVKLQNMEAQKWEEILGALPVKDTEEDEEKRKEVWSIMDLDDSLSLSIFELEKGIAAITMTEDVFDCFPAVETAFRFVKKMSNEDHDKENHESNNEDDKVEEDVVIEHPLLYSEFRHFLTVLRHYFTFCQIFENDDLDEGLQVSREDFCCEDKQEKLKEHVGDIRDICEEFDALDRDNMGLLSFDVLIKWGLQNLNADI